MKKKNGFTLIELLAVIIILGILMIIAIPSVTSYINNSRKSAYVDTAKEIISGARNFVNEGKVPMYDITATYYIKASCISTENGQKSPYGDFVDDETYVIVTYDGQGYDYYWVSRDAAGLGVSTITALKDLDEDDIVSDIAIGTIQTVKISDNKSNVQVIKDNCSEFQGAEETGNGNDPEPICKRAKELHTEICSQTSHYCVGDGYTSGETITYGVIWNGEGDIPTGAAFDCDVNGDGTYDSLTERFYYVSDYYDVNSETPTFDSSTAVLIYYTNTVNGEPSTSGASYSSSQQCTRMYGCNWYGPVTAVTYLPTTSQWSNVSLKTTTRSILGCSDATCSTLSSNTSGGTLPTDFSYEGKAARLITEKEIYEGCYDGVTGLNSTGGLSTKCKFLFENTEYSNSSLGTLGTWFETPNASSSYALWCAYAYSSYTYSNNTFEHGGVRPTIDVLKTNIK